MAEQGTQEAMAEQGTQEAMAEQGTQEAMAEQGTQEAMAEQPPWPCPILYSWSPIAPRKKKSLGGLGC